MTDKAEAEDSLGRRYTYKLGTNLAGLVCSLLTQSIIPRLLGPVAYGSFSFLSAFFNQVVGFLDAGTSIGFFSKLSQRTREAGLLRFYWGFAGIVGIVLTLFVAGVFGGGFNDRLWPGQETHYVWMAAGWGLLLWYTQILNNILDAYAFTVPGEIVRMQQKLLGLGLIALMFWLGRSSLTEFFLYQYVILLFLCIGWWRVLRGNDRVIFLQARLTGAEVKGYSREFWKYSAPLLSYSVVGMLTGVLDRWLLQRFAGSIEQGFFGLSYQISTICFLFTSAMTPLFIREMSKAYGDHDVPRMRAMFQHYIPRLYSICAFLGVFLAVQAQTVVFLFGGASFAGARLATALMALYPIHQTYGQLSGSVFYATGQTRRYRNIGIGMMPVGLVAAAWLLAPARLFGLDLGATGLAIKMVSLQFIQVNVQLWWNSRLLDLSFWKLVGHQVSSVVVLGVVAWGASHIASSLVHGERLTFFASGTLYTLGCIAILLLIPSVFSLTRLEMRIQARRLLTELGM